MFKSTSWCNVEELSDDVKKNLPELELHLMIQNPTPVIAKWIRHAPKTKRAIIHAEILQDTLPLLKEIKAMGIEAGLAINPETSLEEIAHLLPYIDMLLILGVHPGASGQAFLGDAILQKITEAKQQNEQLWVSVDGGVNTKTIERIKKTGVNQICIGSALFEAENTEQAFASFSVDN